MKNKILVLGITALILGMLVLVTATPGNSAKNIIKPQIFEKKLSISDNKYVPDEIIVKFKSGVRDDVISKINSGHGASVKYTSPYGKFKRIGIPKHKTVSEMVEIYSKNPNVEYAELNYIAYALMVPNDPLYNYQWHLDNPVYSGIQMEEAWDISTGSNVIVAVIDTGVAYENYGWRYKLAPDLAGTSFVQGYDFVNDDTHPNDDNSHGTHVTGTIAQTTNNGLGVAGVAFNAKIMPVKVLDKSGSGYYSWIAEGIHYATDNGAKVISLSLGGGDDSETLKNAVKYAYENGVTVIAATGNDASSTISYPAAYDDYVIAVGATRYDETLAYYSNYGPSLDLVAPGGDLTIDQNGDGYGDGVLQNTFNPNTKNTRDFGYWFLQGTSMATPHVSGVAALVIANGNANTPDEVRAALQETAEDLGANGKDDIYGYGIVDAYAALGWTSAPECTVDTDCDDGVSCTYDSCVSEVCVYTPNDANCPEDGWVDTEATQWVSTGQCTEKEQREQEYRDYYCDSTLDCRYTVAGTQWLDTGTTGNKADGTSCEDEEFCTVGDTCQAGVCHGGTTRDCDDGEPCTTDTCDEEIDACEHTWPSCELDDGCCGPECSSVEGDPNYDSDCAVAEMCWSADYQYLYRNKDQAKKFCKCAMGTYGYNSYSYSWGRKKVFYYVDSGNNVNWKVTSRSSYLPVYAVTCTDSNVYLTNENYWYD